METMIQQAIKHKFVKLCFTDHYDYDYPSTPELAFDIDLPNYHKSFLQLKAKYKNQIKLLFGIEVGLQPHIYDITKQTIDSYPFDFVIASTHVVDRLDPYFGSYYENKTKKEAYSRYLEDIYHNVTHYDDYNVYGHLDYIIRYGHYDDKKLYYHDHKEVIDKILSRIIETGHGIELNTSGYRKNFNEPHPNIDIIKRYRQLGGEIITIGSDAHYPEHLAYNFDIAYEVLHDCGFKYFTVFEKRKPDYIKIPI
ncbi:phosphoesterase [Vallitalea longa]|uniref:Histidinol-phosphatase n=2 Tax=Vallitalea longa TaxID=2936439 RepID=A0A9W5Y936_9FIRM|nr:phosphoesterase [Vallitalea longa]